VTSRRRSILVYLASLIVLLACLSIPAGSFAQAPTGQIVVVDDLHQRIVLPGPATRILSLAPSNTEILLALGLKSRIVGVDSDSFTYLPSPYRTQLKGLRNVGSAYSGLNLEAIAQAHPDLALVIPGTQDIAHLKALHIPVVTLEPQNLAGIYYDILVVAKATGTVPRGESLVRSLEASVASVRRAVAHLARPTVFYEIDPSIYTAGPGSFIDQIISLAGGRNAVDPYVKTAYPKVSSETVIRANPDDIVLGDVPYVTAKAVAARPGWGSITAVREHHIFTNIDPSLLQEPGPAIVQALTLLAEDIHPGLVLGRR
jgi:iron complex transport system substrate-binding protein